MAVEGTTYYQIINCANKDEIYCTTSDLSAYKNNGIENPNSWPVIQVIEKPGKCFYVEQIRICTAPIPITKDPAIQVVAGCAKCQAKEVVYYKLINCNDPQIYIYTSTELTQYLGKYITLEEYGNECFYVSVEQGLVPSDINVTPTGESYATCEACSLPKYRLFDCTGVNEDIITNTDLSEYIGKVIVLETCPDICWQVEEINSTTLNGDVYPISNFIDCPTCLKNILPAKCVTFKNTTQDTITVTVYNTDGISTTITINAGETTTKACYIQWETLTGIVVTDYGLCVNGQCPEVKQPKRKVTPGYNTPACTAEYYENVECHFSEWMYKDVLEKRYGISNCCPDDLMRWEIKHEMLMLDALINPDYTCLPTVNCGCAQPTTCNCSCNSGN